jgi:hypothetical protein
MKKIIAIIIGTGVMVVLGFILFGTEKIPTEFQLKAPKENFISYQIKQGTAFYTYKDEPMEVIKDEIVSQRTSNARYFKSQKPNQTIMEVSVGAPYYQDENSEWYYVSSATTTEEYFAQQTKPTLVERILGKKALADTIDVQVGASADDGTRYTGLNGFASDRSTEYIGNSSESGYLQMHSFHRFTGLTMSGTIDTAYAQLYDGGEAGTPQFKIHVVLADNPAAPTTAGEFDAASLSTGIDWDGTWGTGWVQSPELKTIFQALVNAYTISNDAVMVQIKNDHASTENYIVLGNYDHDTGQGLKLHIEYTAGGATAKNSGDSGVGADARLSFLTSLARTDTGGGSESATGRGLVIKDYGGGADALTALIAAVLAAETGSGVEQSTLTSMVAKLSAETGLGIDIAGLVARLASGETGVGVDAGMIPGLKSIFGGDGGVGGDALKALIETSGAGSDMKLPGRQGHVRIPSKGVSL